LDDLDIQGCANNHGIQIMNNFNPHVVFNVNHLQRDAFGANEHRLSFTWVQDRMLYIRGEQTLKQLEAKEHLFTLLPEFQDALQKQGIPSTPQSFCLNDELFQRDENIIREKKIVFIGSSYGSKIGDRMPQEMMSELVASFSKGELTSQDIRDKITNRYKTNDTTIAIEAVEFIVRDLSVIWLCSIHKECPNYSIEIYGKGWDIYEEVKPFYKGVVEYGKDLADIYNSATYAFAPHSLYILQQRTLESSACGSIPIVYDIRGITQETHYDEAVEYFKTQQDLIDILNQKEIPKKDFTRLLKENSYSTFVKKMVDIIKDEVKKCQINTI